MITFQIAIPANASVKDVANAIKIRAQLMEAGIAEGMIAPQTLPQIARCASPILANGQTPEERQLRDEYKAANPSGRGFRFTKAMKSAFTRDASGKVVLTYPAPIDALRAWKAGTLVDDSATGEDSGNGSTGDDDGDSF